MRPSRWYVYTLIIGLGFGAANCKDDEFTKTCRMLCQALNCADGIDVEACTDEHRDRLDAASEVSESCAERYREMIECVVVLQGCSEVANWESLRGLTLDYPCKVETEDFLVVCPDLWFEKKDVP